MTTPVEVLARMITLFEEYGVVVTGSKGIMLDSTKVWSFNEWTGHRLFFYQSGVLYSTQITGNDPTHLYFVTLPDGVYPYQATIYWIQPPALTGPMSRWGIPIEPDWTYAGIVVAPAAGSVLVSQSVDPAVSGYIFGFYISAPEPNVFTINWISSGKIYQRLIQFTAGGSTQDSDSIAMNAGILADPLSTITLTNVNAGSAGSHYQANLLFAET
jgi:hypothetical protein